MFDVGGLRHELNLFDFIKPDNIQIINTVRRYGEPFLTEMVKLIGEIENKSDHETTF
jgi:phage-related holin